MKHIVCLTKTYRKSDMEVWLKYHRALGYKLHIIDNESIENIKDLITDDDTYEELKGWPNQWQLYDDILKDNRYNFVEGDLIAFIDDDEYLWYQKDYWREWTKYYYGNPYVGTDLEIEQYIIKQMDEYETDCILLPQILMSSQTLIEQRKHNLIDNLLYTRPDNSSQGKVIIRYKQNNTYKFNKENVETGHVPYINGIRRSVINGCGYTNSTYSEVDRTAVLRLYHYHIKSKEDWEKKWNRGSAAVDHQWYEKDIEKNKNFGNYIIEDRSMAEMKKVLEI